MFLYIVIAIVIFGLLIAVHELGHFAAAKWLGVKVNEFSIGMGPPLLKHEGEETLYSLRLLPIGGFCSMEGEDDDSADPRAFGRAAAWKKLIILAAGAAMNFLVGLILCLALTSTYQYLATPVIADFAEEFDLVGENGLMQGDRILRVNGERVYTQSDISLLFPRGNGETMDLLILRDGEKRLLQNFPLTLRPYTQDGQQVMRYGINFQVIEPTLPQKLREGTMMAVDFVRLVRLSLMDLLTGEVGVREMSGPVGIVGIISDVGSAAETPKYAMYGIMNLAALIAVNLAVMNLLPLPALDGGRIFFILLNGIIFTLSRKKIDAKYEGYVHFAGLVALMGLILFVTLSDIGKIFGH